MGEKCTARAEAWNLDCSGMSRITVRVYDKGEELRQQKGVCLCPAKTVVPFKYRRLNFFPSCCPQSLQPFQL